LTDIKQVYLLTNSLNCTIDPLTKLNWTYIPNMYNKTSTMPVELSHELHHNLQTFQPKFVLIYRFYGV